MTFYEDQFNRKNYLGKKMRLDSRFFKITFIMFASALLMAGCKDTTDADSIIPVGSYTDNYGGSHTFSEGQWSDSYGSTFSTIKQDKIDNYVIYQNSASNSYNPSKFSRVDFTEDSNSDLYYCQIAYDKDTADEAEATSTANKSDLSSGCNGFGWSKLTKNP